MLQTLKLNNKKRTYEEIKDGLSWLLDFELDSFQITLKK